MGENSGLQGGFKCCLMCMRYCFEKHGDFGRQEAEQLFSAPSFSSLIKASHIAGTKFLRIPVRFFEKQNYNIGDKLRLRGPSGFECECTVRRHSNGYVLDPDFNQFLDHHAIEAGDVLVFYLIAKEYFLIKVYDTFGAEKVSPTNNPSSGAEPVLPSKSSHRLDPKRGSSSKESRREEDVEDSDKEDVDEGSDEEAIDRTSNLRRKQLGKEVEVSSREETKGVDEGSAEEAIDRLRNLRRKQLGKEPEESSREDTKGRESSDKVEPSFDYAANMAFLTEELGAPRHRYSGQKRKHPDSVRRGENEQERAKVITSFISGVGQKKEAATRQINAANALIQKLKNPSQLVFMKNSHVAQCKTVYLSQLPLPDQTEVLTLVDEAGEQYTVKWMVPPDGRSRLSSGWDQFVYDHKIAIDDACLFEANGIHLITVYIFRLADYCNPTTENQQQEQDHRDDLQLSALDQSISEELGSPRGQEVDTASAGLHLTSIGKT